MHSPASLLRCNLSPSVQWVYLQVNKHKIAVNLGFKKVSAGTILNKSGLPELLRVIFFEIILVISEASAVRFLPTINHSKGTL